MQRGCDTPQRTAVCCPPDLSPSFGHPSAFTSGLARPTSSRSYTNDALHHLFFESRHVSIQFDLVCLCP
jgi:hypothetical protein